MSSTSTRPASEATVRFIGTLYVERDLSNYEKAEAVARVVKGDLVIPQSSASACIDELKALPMLAAKTSAPAEADTTVVPEGRYAIEFGGSLKFYKVDRPTEGKWAGRTFVKVQASDDLHPIKNPTARLEILTAIAKAGPKEASARYGHELGVCGVCGRTLTDETSRERGIGPICFEKF